MAETLSRGMTPGKSAGQVCPLCGGAGEWDCQVEGYDLRVCDCVPPGALLSWCWESVAEYQDWYRSGDDYHRAQQRREGQCPYQDRDGEHLAAARSRVRVLDAHLGYPQGKMLLDVGAGSGAFVEIAERESDWDVVGIEPNRELALWAAAKYRWVEAKGWEDLEDTGQHWDAITLHDVIEHMVNPGECLDRLRTMLRPDGLLVLELPEFASPFGNWQRHIRPRQHLWLPSRPAMEEFLSRRGFRIEAFHRPLRGSLGKMSFFCSQQP